MIKKILLILIFLSGFCGNIFSQNPIFNTPFAKIRELAEKAIDLYDKGDRSEETLWTLQEAMLRGQDWLTTPDEEELMSQVVARIWSLRKELYDVSDQELMFLMLNSTVSTVTKDKNTFENIPNIYPDFKEISSDPKSSMAEAINLMEKGEMKEAEKILLILFYDTWYNRNNHAMKYEVANKLGMYYLKMQLPERCYELLRTNKIEMEQRGIINKDYIENLVYMGFAQMQRYSTPIIGHVFLEVATLLSRKTNFDPGEIAKDYNRVMSNLNMNNGLIESFIRENDRNFYFLTERERIIRWENIKDTWEGLKTYYYDQGNGKNIDELLNAFQYEKQILLRSALKVKDLLKESQDSEAVSMVDSLLNIKMEMTSPKAAASYYDNLEADYQRIQKYLMHHPALEKSLQNKKGGLLYSPVSSGKIASQLKENETFLDIGKIVKGRESIYLAIMINKASPEGLIVPLISEKSLKEFISMTDSEDSKTMVRQRYDNNFLYDNIWKPIENTGLVCERILYCPTDELNVIMPDAIKKGDEYLGEKYEFHILSSAENLDDVRNGEIYKPEGIISFCGMDYIGNREELIRIAQKFGSERPLKKNPWDSDDYDNPGIHIKTSVTPLDTEEDYQWLRDLGRENDTKIGLWAGERANEYVFKKLGTYKGTVNISTHAFNLPRGYHELGNHYASDQFIRLVTVEPLTTDLLPLYRTGLFFSGAERSWTGRKFIDGIEDGIVNGEEISSLDLSGLELLTLMACSTGAGEVDEYEGIIGIRRAFKMAGVGSLVTTAWNLDKEAAISYLKIFYTNLVKGEGISWSHRKAQLELIKKYEDPYYWAVFQLID